VEARCSQLVLGLDPDPTQLWPRAAAGAPTTGAPAARAAAAVTVQCELLIDAAGPACVAVKPQLACFERLGDGGWAALATISGYARAAGLLVLLDGKRGDVPVTASAYAQALLGPTPTPFGELSGLGADAFTANPLLGRDSLAPLLDGAAASGAGVFVLVRTSNAGAADVEDATLEDGERLWERLARIVADLGRSRTGSSGLSDVGAVTGATEPQHLERMRELMPHAPFLLPGVGAQGGRVEDLGPAFAPGRAGGLIATSRAIADAYKGGRGDPARAAADEAERLRELAWTLAPA